MSNNEERMTIDEAIEQIMSGINNTQTLISIDKDGTTERTDFDENSKARQGFEVSSVVLTVGMHTLEMWNELHLLFPEKVQEQVETVFMKFMAGTSEPTQDE